MRILRGLFVGRAIDILPRVLDAISLVCQTLVERKPTRTHFLHAGITWVEVIGIYRLAICADDQSRFHFLHFFADASHIEI